MLRDNDKEAKSILANTSNKIFLRVEEMEMTAKLAVESTGKGFQTQAAGFSGHAGEMNMSYRDNMEARIEMIDRVNPTDLKALGGGQAAPPSEH